MPNSRVRLFALVRGRRGSIKVRHVVGAPPEPGQRPSGQLLPWPDVVILEEDPDGSTYLYRLTRSGTHCGDTWHPSQEDAQRQASYEYGDALGEWQRIPDIVRDPQEFAASVARG
jgi:hypothetical protein